MSPIATATKASRPAVTPLWLQLSLLLASLLLPLCSQASTTLTTPLSIDEEFSHTSLAPWLFWSEDKHLIPSDITASRPNLEDLQAPFKQQINQNFNSNPFWYRLNILKTYPTAQLFYMELNRPLIDEIQVYREANNGKLQLLYHTGDIFPFSQRPVYSNHFLFPLPLENTGNYIYWLRIKTKNLHHFNIDLYHADAFIEHNTYKNLLNIVTYGVIISLMLYHLLLFATVRERVYLDYALVTLSLGVILGIHEGYSHMLLWPNSAFLQDHTALMVPGLLAAAILQYSRSFMQLSLHAPNSDKIAKWLVIIFIISLPHSILINDPGQSKNITFASWAISISFGLITSIHLWIKGNRLGKLFFLNTSPIICFAIPILIASLSFNILDLKTLYALFKFSVAVQIILMAAIIGDKFQRIKIEKEDLKQKQLKTETEINIKSEFLAKMSHEIRTPMNGVIGMSDLLADTPLNTEQRQYTEAIRSSGKSLLNIINDILDFSKLEASKIHIENVPMSLPSLLQDIQQLFKPDTSSSQRIFLTSIHDNIPNCIVADPYRIQQVLINLVSNAFKFTRDGTIKLEIGETPGKANFIRFQVTDTGIGITKEKQDNLFDSFSQADESITRRFGGTGLGLNISRQLVELMSGSIDFKSSPGEGSCFWFDLPAIACCLLDDKPLDIAKVTNILNGKRILIVEDNPEKRSLLDHWLNNYVEEIRSFCRVDDTLEYLSNKHKPYDLISLDYHLPDGNGENLARDIRKLTLYKDTPIVLLSASKNISSSQQHPHITLTAEHPCVKEELLKIYSQAFLKQQGLPEDNEDIRSIKKYYGAKHILLVEDNKINILVSKKMLRKLGHNVDVAINGIEAMEYFENSKEAYDLILMDCEMPQMDGFQATLKLREHGFNKPIIALTAHAVEQYIQRCKDVGMNDILHKPLSSNDLEDMLRKWQ